MEQQAAGLRTEPHVSVPRLKSTAPLATALALPLLLPPGMSEGDLAFRGHTADAAASAARCERPVVPSMEKANSSMTAHPAGTAPASASDCTQGATRALLRSDRSGPPPPSPSATAAR